ncbi:MAG: glycosyltransferase family 39 protein [Verrucomicrobiota bacterium]|nr:glycosyltransferase family 39 protein [Verrucomicrobiota bacterium]
MHKNIVGILSKYSRIIDFGLISAAVLLAFSSLILQYKLITTPLPLEIREGLMPLVTGIILDGYSPYQKEFLPLYLNVYGLGYNLVSACFALIFGNTFLVHRTVTAISILLLTLLTWTVIRRLHVSLVYTIAASCILYAILVGQYSNAARPDYLGALFFWSSIYLAGFHQNRIKVLLLSVILGVAAFYTKPYFGLFMPAVTMGLLCVGQRINAIIYLICSILLLILTGIFFQSQWPAYFYSTIQIHLNTNEASTAHLIPQIRDYVVIHWGLIVILICGLYLIYVKVNRGISGRILLRHWKSKFYSKSYGIYNSLYYIIIIFIFLCCASIWLSRNTGNYLIYFIQLCSPVLIVTSIYFSDKYNRLLGKLILTFYIVFLQMDMPNVPVYSQQYDEEIRSLINDKSLLCSSLAYYSLTTQADIYNAGSTEYFYSPLINSSENQFINERLIVSKFEHGIIENIKNKVYEKAFVESSYPSLMPKNIQDALMANYRSNRTYFIPFHYSYWRNRSLFGSGEISITIWEPITNTRDATFK